MLDVVSGDVLVGKPQNEILTKEATKEVLLEELEDKEEYSLCLQY